ncbi:hypothetical protein ACLOJK_037885 [Asimina triloba]
MYTAVYLDWWARFPTSSSSAHIASGSFGGSKYSSFFLLGSDPVRPLMEQSSSSDVKSKTSQFSTRVAATATDCDCFSDGLISHAQGCMAHRLRRMQILSLITHRF